jgi:diphthamide biosynthesis protein 2
LLDDARVREAKRKEEEEAPAGQNEETARDEGGDDAEYDSEEESAPPEFDLRTGRYVSHSRPMQQTATPASKTVQQSSGDSASGATPASSALTRRANGHLASVNGVVSPGAEFLRSKRTWVGLGSDYNNPENEDGSSGHAAKMEEGRSGIARGYHLGEDAQKH